MGKNIWGNVVFSVITVLSELIILLAYVTQSAGFQLIAIQEIYWSLDKSWVTIRVIILSFIMIAGTLFLFLHRTKPILVKSFKFGLFTTIIGLFLGLSIFYEYSCCDMPVSFLMGFPMSWLRGLSEAQNRLPSAILQYLFQNIFTINWKVDFICLFIDILFWYNLGIIGFVTLYPFRWVKAHFDKCQRV